MKLSALTAVVAVAAMGCGGGSNPKNYVGSVEQTVYSALPASCLPSGASFGNTVTETNEDFQLNYSIWTSDDGKITVLTTSDFTDLVKKLTVGAGGAAAFSAGAAGNLTSTDGKTFVETAVNAHTGDSTDAYTDTIKVTFTFADTSYTKGTIEISAARTCSGDGCDTASPTFSCDAGAAAFIGSQVQGTTTTFYTGN